MPIKVACKCGKAFAAKDELAGKTVKCPGCGEPIKIPAAGQGTAPAGGAAAAPRPAAKPAAAAKPQAPAPQPASLKDLFDEAGLGAHKEDTRPRCPGCDSPLDPSAVFCTKCGLNFQTGKRTRGVGGAVIGPASKGHATGHEAAADALLAKAEKALKDSPMTIDEGKDSWLSAWLMLLALIAAAGVAFVLWLAVGQIINAPEPDPAAPEVAGGTDLTSIRIVFLVMMGAGALLMAIAQIMIAVYAFQKDDTLQGLLCLFIGIYTIIYAVMRWEKLQRELMMYGASIILYMLGIMLLFISVLPPGAVPPPDSLAKVVIALLILAVYMIAWLLYMAAMVWSIVVGFMEKWYHGVCALLIPAYGCVFALARKEEHGFLAKIWLSAMGCGFGAPALVILLSLMFGNVEGQSKLVIMGALALAVGVHFAPLIAALFVSSGLFYGSAATFNALFADKKTKLELPPYMASLRFGLGAVFAIFLTFSFPQWPMWIAGNYLMPILIGVLVTFPQVLFIGADLSDRYLSCGFVRGLAISAFHGLLLLPIYVGLCLLTFWAAENVPVFVTFQEQF